MPTCEFLSTYATRREAERRAAEAYAREQAIAAALTHIDLLAQDIEALARLFPDADATTIAEEVVAILRTRLSDEEVPCGA